MNIFEKLSDEYNHHRHDCFQDCDENKRFNGINEYLKAIKLNDEQIKNVCELIDTISDESWNKGESSGYYTGLNSVFNGEYD